MDQSDRYTNNGVSSLFFGGGLAEKFKQHAILIISLLTVIIVGLIILVVLYSLGKMPGQSTASVSSFDGNNPNWKMGSFDAGAGGPLDDGTGNCLNWGNGCKSHMFGHKSHAVAGPNSRIAHMAPGARISNLAGHRSGFRENLDTRADQGPVNPYDAVYVNDPNKSEAENASNRAAYDAARAAAAQAYLQATSGVVAHQNQVLAGCSNSWDAKATEEAQVLNSIGVYKSPTPGMSGFIRSINGNTTLSDAQLEAIMQGGEPLANPTWNFRQDGQQLGATSTVRN